MICEHMLQFSSFPECIVEHSFMKQLTEWTAGSQTQNTMLYKDPSGTPLDLPAIEYQNCEQGNIAFLGTCCEYLPLWSNYKMLIMQTDWKQWQKKDITLKERPIQITYSDYIQNKIYIDFSLATSQRSVIIT